MLKTINLYNSRFYDLLPPNLRNPHTAALSVAFDKQMKRLLDSIKVVYILALVDEMDAAMCDTVARQFNIEEYDFSLDLPQKRALINLMFKLGSKKGTHWIVDQMITTMLHSGETSEWFDFEGDPYLFRVTYDTEGNTEDDVARFLRSLWTVKRESAWLERITRRSRVDQTIHVSALANTGGEKKHRLTPPPKARYRRPVHIFTIVGTQNKHMTPLTPPIKAKPSCKLSVSPAAHFRNKLVISLLPPKKQCVMMQTYTAFACASYTRQIHRKGPINDG